MSGSWSEELFRSSALGELRGKFGKQADVLLDGVLSEFGPNRDSTVVDEVLRLREWLRAYSFSAEVAPAEKLVIGVTAPIGGGAVLIQLQASLDFMADDGSIRDAKPIEVVMTANSLLGQCMTIYKAIRSTGAEDMPAGREPQRESAASSGNGKPPAPTGEMVECSTLVISNEKGERRYKVKGGGYQKFGLSVYPERVPAEWADLPYGEHVIGPVWCRTDGKKVVSWE